MSPNSDYCRSSHEYTNVLIDGYRISIVASEEKGLVLLAGLHVSETKVLLTGRLVGGALSHDTL